jgi:serine O-acetyltransferase
LRAAIRADLDRYVFGRQQLGVTGRLAPLRIGLGSPGLWATTAYRVNHYTRRRLGSRPLVVLAHVLHFIIRTFTGIHIDSGAHIGPGLKLPHAGHLVIGPVRIGRNCDIFHGVTMGKSNSSLRERPSQPDVPTLGDRVYVGPGAVIAGGVMVNNDAVVGANSLLVQDVQPRGVMIGVPARLVSKSGSLAQIVYRGMENDKERNVAVAADVAAGAAGAAPVRPTRSVSGLPERSQ